MGHWVRCAFQRLLLLLLLLLLLVMMTMVDLNCTAWRPEPIKVYCFVPELSGTRKACVAAVTVFNFAVTSTSCISPPQWFLHLPDSHRHCLVSSIATSGVV